MIFLLFCLDGSSFFFLKGGDCQGCQPNTEQRYVSFNSCLPWENPMTILVMAIAKATAFKIKLMIFLGSSIFFLLGYRLADDDFSSPVFNRLSAYDLVGFPPTDDEPHYCNQQQDHHNREGDPDDCLGGLYCLIVLSDCLQHVV
jgi:hypothetical protein